MLSTKEISQKIADAYGKRERLNATLERHTSTLEKKKIDFEKKYRISPEKISGELVHGSEQAYWEYYAIQSKVEDIKSVQQKIKYTDERIEKLKGDLRAAEAQQAFMDNDIPGVIKNFFETWKNDSISFFVNRYDEYQEYVQQLRDRVHEARVEAIKTLPEYAQYVDRLPSMDEYAILNVFPRQPMQAFLKERELDTESVNEKKNSFAGPIVSAMCRYNNSEQRTQYLEKTIDREMRERMIDLVQRIGEHVGKITDAQGLHIQNGEIAGTIIGERGRASIQTVGAGGYNIQRYHFRTLVHPLEAFSERDINMQEQDADDDECEMDT